MCVGYVRIRQDKELVDKNSIANISDSNKSQVTKGLPLWIYGIQHYCENITVTDFQPYHLKSTTIVILQTSALKYLHSTQLKPTVSDHKKRTLCVILKTSPIYHLSNIWLDISKMYPWPHHSIHHLYLVISA